MAALRLGDPSEFPFVDPPELRSIRDGIALLEELDAVDPDKVNTRGWLTPLGRQLARLPIDPRLGRMVLEASDNGCVREVMIIAAGLSIQDPRERPSDKRELAAESHQRFTESGSDLLSFIDLWNYIEEQRKARSSNQFRKMCRAEFLNYLRIREWQDIFGQLGRELKQLNIDINTIPAKPDAIHMSLLAGLLSHIGYLLPPKETPPRRGPRQRKELPEYQGSRSTRFAVARDSALAKTTPTWVMATELVETNRLWARNVAKIEPEWAERLAEHLTNHSYSEPWWDEAGGSAVTKERVTLYGLPIVAGRRVQLGRVDADTARQMFIHHALVEGEIGAEWRSRHAFVPINQAVIAEVDSLGARARRADLVAHRSAIHEFYDQRVGEEVTSAGHFNRWWKQVRRNDPTLLDMTVKDLVDFDESLIDAEAFPEFWHDGDVELAVSYEFDGTSTTDGVIVTIPVEVVNQLDSSGFDWTVPGHRADLVTALIRSLPKNIRKHFVPVPDTVKLVLETIDPSHGGVLEALCRELSRISGVAVPVDAMDLSKVPDHLRPTLRIVDDNGGTIAEGKDLRAIRSDVQQALLEVLASTEAELGQTASTTWTFGTIESSIATERGGHRVVAHPALFDDGEAVSLRLMATAEEQALTHWDGCRRLLRLSLPSPVRQLDSLLGNSVKLSMAADVTQSKTAWYNDIIAAAIDAEIQVGPGLPWNEAAYDGCQSALKESFPSTLARTAKLSGRIITASVAVRAQLEDRRGGPRASAISSSVLDGEHHLARLLYRGVTSGVGLDRLDDLLRYLSALDYRLEKLPERVTQDQRDMLRCRALEADHARLAATSERVGEVEAIGWSLQEFRVSVFAQHLGTAESVSEKRLRTAIRRAHGV